MANLSATLRVYTHGKHQYGACQDRESAEHYVCFYYKVQPQRLKIPRLDDQGID